MHSVRSNRSLIKSSSNLLFCLFGIYYAQGIFYPSGSLISQISLLLILFISALFLIKTLLIKNRNSKFYKVWTAFLGLNVLGFLFTADYGNTNHINMFKGIIGCFLLFYPFYYYARAKIIKSAYFFTLLCLLLPLTILQFYLNKNAVLTSSNSENIVNNIAYLFVALIPFVFFIKKKVLSVAIMMTLMFFIIQGAKRGAVIAGSIGLCLYVYFQLKNVKKAKKIQGYLVAALVVIILIIFAYHTFSNNQFLIHRMDLMEEGNTSNRDIIWRQIFNSWYNSNFYHFLIGFGFAGSLLLTGGNYAHNDWLELLANFGLIGVLLYLLLFVTAFNSFLNSKLKDDKKILILTITLIWFLISLGLDVVYCFNQLYLLDPIGIFNWWKTKIIRMNVCFYRAFLNNTI